MHDVQAADVVPYQEGKKKPRSEVTIYTRQQVEELQEVRKTYFLTFTFSGFRRLLASALCQLGATAEQRQGSSRTGQLS